MDSILDGDDVKTFNDAVEAAKVKKAEATQAFTEELKRAKKDLEWEERRRRELEGCEANEREMQRCFTQARHLVRKERQANRITHASAAMLLKALQL